MLSILQGTNGPPQGIKGTLRGTLGTPEETRGLLVETGSNTVAERPESLIPQSPHPLRMQNNGRARRSSPPQKETRIHEDPRDQPHGEMESGRALMCGGTPGAGSGCM